MADREAQQEKRRLIGRIPPPPPRPPPPPPPPSLLRCIQGRDVPVMNIGSRVLPTVAHRARAASQRHSRHRSSRTRTTTRPKKARLKLSRFDQGAAELQGQPAVFVQKPRRDYRLSTILEDLLKRIAARPTSLNSTEGQPSTIRNSLFELMQ